LSDPQARVKQNLINYIFKNRKFDNQSKQKITEDDWSEGDHVPKKIEEKLVSKKINQWIEDSSSSDEEEKPEFDFSEISSDDSSC
jgi:hypothetical protein